MKLFFVPVYGLAEDEQALAVLATACPDWTLIPIRCEALLEQHGSLHCATIQIINLENPGVFNMANANFIAAVIQQAIEGNDKSANLDKTEHLIRDAVEKGAELIVLQRVARHSIFLPRREH